MAIIVAVCDLLGMRVLDCETHEAATRSLVSILGVSESALLDFLSSFRLDDLPDDDPRFWDEGYLLLDDLVRVIGGATEFDFTARLDLIPSATSSRSSLRVS